MNDPETEAMDELYNQNMALENRLKALEAKKPLRHTMLQVIRRQEDVIRKQHDEIQVIKGILGRAEAELDLQANNLRIATDQVGTLNAQLQNSNTRFNNLLDERDVRIAELQKETELQKIIIIKIRHLYVLDKSQEKYVEDLCKNGGSD